MRNTNIFCSFFYISEEKWNKYFIEDRDKIFSEVEVTRGSHFVCYTFFWIIAQLLDTRYKKYRYFSRQSNVKNIFSSLKIMPSIQSTYRERKVFLSLIFLRINGSNVVSVSRMESIILLLLCKTVGQNWNIILVSYLIWPVVQYYSL